MNSHSSHLEKKGNMLKEIKNRPGLSHIDYRIGTYNLIRKFMIDKLEHCEELKTWSYRGPDDPGIALIESSAIVCDILTFYQELYANEAFLRTARLTENIKKLLQLTGYRLTPGTAGEGYFFFEVNGNKPINIPLGFLFSAQLESIEESINFETSETIVAYPEFSSIKLYRLLKTPDLSEDVKEFYFLESSLSAINAGDKLLVFRENECYNTLKKPLLSFEFLIVEEIYELHGRTAFSFKGSLKNICDDTISNGDNLFAYKIGRSFRAFGHNAPTVIVDTSPTSPETKSILSNDSFYRPNYYEDFINPEIKHVEFPLDVEIDDLVAGTNIAVQYIANSKSYSIIKRIDEIKKGSFTFGTLTGAASVITFGQLEDDLDWIGGLNTFLSDLPIIVVQGIGPIRSNKLNRKDIYTVNDLASISAYNLSTELNMPAHLLYEFKRKAQIIRNLYFDTEIITILEDKNFSIHDAMELTFEQLQEVSDLDKVSSQKFLQRIRSLTMVMDQEKCRELSINNLKLKQDGFDLGTINVDIREMQFHEILGSCLEIKPLMEVSQDQEVSKFVLYGDENAFKRIENHTLIFTHPNQEPSFVNVDYLDNADGFFSNNSYRLITLNKYIEIDPSTTRDKPISFEGIEYIVNGNIAYATQGKMEDEIILGSGDNRKKYQTFKLLKSPLTYLFQAEETPAEVPELKIYVNNCLWTRVPSFLNRTQDEEIYIIRQDDNNDNYVQFIKLPSGIDNITAVYRTGIGAYGPLKEGTSVNAGEKLDNLEAINSITKISGGSQPETGLHARETAPRKFQSLDRLVSLKDYETTALAYSGVLKAKATINIDIDNIPCIFITILTECDVSDEFNEIEKNILDYDKYHGPQRYPIKVEQVKFKYVNIKVSYLKDVKFKKKDVETAIENALGVYISEDKIYDNPGGLYNIFNQEFGQVEYWSRIEGTIQNVKGVLGVKISSLGYYNSETQDPTLLTDDELITIEENTNMYCNSKQILRLYYEHLHLTCSEEEK